MRLCGQGMGNAFDYENRPISVLDGGLSIDHSVSKLLFLPFGFLRRGSDFTIYIIVIHYITFIPK